MYMYSQLIPEPCYVWTTGEENEIVKYMSLLDSALEMEESVFNLYERKLLLLALTYRICSIHNRKLNVESDSMQISFVCLPSTCLRLPRIFADIQYRSLSLKLLFVSRSHYSKIHRKTFWRYLMN